MTNHPVNPSDDAPDEPPRRTPGGIESWLAGAWIGALVAVIIVVAFMAGRDHGSDESVNKAATPPAKTTGAPAATTETTATATTEEPAAGGATSSGKEVFATTCGGCHTLAAAGTSGAVGPDLDQLKPDLALVEKAIKIGGTGAGAMPPNLLQGADATAVAKYVADNAGK